MSLTTKNKEIIKEVPWGVYVWKTRDGNYVSDDEDNFMLVFCEEGNQEAIKALRDAATYYGHGDGTPVYWTGKRPVTDEEYEHQLQRSKFGLTPDPLDIGAIRDEQKALRQQNA